LQTRDANLRVLFTSGYSSEVVCEDRHLIVGVNFLRKPYDPGSLLKAVRMCLDTQVRTSEPDARKGNSMNLSLRQRASQPALTRT